VRGKGGLVQILVQDFANPLSVGFSENHSENEHGLPLEVMPRASAGAGRAGGGGSGGVGGGSWLCKCASKGLWGRIWVNTSVPGAAVNCTDDPEPAWIRQAQVPPEQLASSGVELWWAGVAWGAGKWFRMGWVGQCQMFDLICPGGR